jgi:hypothetical protein
VRFEPQRAWLFLGAQTMSVPQIPTRRGLLYTNRTTTFAVERDKARLELTPHGPAHGPCVNQPDEASRALK